MFSRIFGVDFVVHKELAVKPEYSSKILVTGMWKGLFGGYGIRDFINATKCDYYGCMKTLNQFDGTYAQQVAQYANQMRDAWGNPKGKCNTLPPSLQPSSEEMTIADSLKEKLLS